MVYCNRSNRAPGESRFICDRPRERRVVRGSVICADAYGELGDAVAYPFCALTATSYVLPAQLVDAIECERFTR